jgi:hypothetical protein
MFEVRGEDGAAQVGRDVGEEGLLLLGPDGVEFAESEADEAVGGGIGNEGLGNRGGQPDGLSLLVSISRCSGEARCEITVSFPLVGSRYWRARSPW